MSTNPYAAPKAAVSDVEDAQEYQEVRHWSAQGRIGRLRYLAYMTGAYLLAIALVGGTVALLGETPGGIATIVAYLAALVYVILVSIQRSHDMNWSGWTVLLQIIPLVGLIWIFKPGTQGTNDYGAPPPPNTTGVKILGLLLPILFIIGMVAAIAIPAYVQYQQRAAGM